MIQLSSLPDLTGTEKQIKWANQIRSQCITGIRSALLTAQGRVASGKLSAETAQKSEKVLLQVLCSHADASWWIENREDYDEIIRDEWQDALRGKLEVIHE